MQWRNLLTALVVVAFLTVPLAQADWKGRGTHEPDTLQDRAGGFMFPDPDWSPDPDKRQVYFNVQPYQDRVAVSPNSGELGSAIMPYPTRAHALLGVWKDCNQDGYIGMPEGFFMWYPSQLLIDTSICPPQNVNYLNNNREVVWNDGGWVREWITIGPDFPGDQGAEPANDTYIFNVADEEARIWGDFGLSTEGAFPTCPLTPLPRGTWESTGGFLRYADCHIGWQATSTFDAVVTALGQEDLSFRDAPKERPDQSQSPLNVQHPYGDPHGQPAVSAFDCSQDPVMVDDPVGPVVVPDPTGGELGAPWDPETNEWEAANLGGEDGKINVTNTPRGVPVLNPSGSIAASVNETLEGAAGDCDGSEGTGRNSEIVYDLQVADHEGVTGPRARTDFSFDYVEPSYGVPYSPGTGCLVPGRPVTCHPDDSKILGTGNEIAGRSTPVLVYGHHRHDSDGWFGNPGYTSSRNPYFNKETLQPWGATYITWYAYVSPLTGLLPGASGTYGSDHCSGGAPTTGLWQCDPDQWHRGPNGEDLWDPDGNGFSWLAKVGFAYNLRDVDCYDHSPARALGGAISLSLVGERQCDR